MPAMPIRQPMIMASSVRVMELGSVFKSSMERRGRSAVCWWR